MSRPQPDQRFWSLSGSPTLIFRFLVAAITSSTGIGITYALMNRPAFVCSFPGAAAPVIYAAFLITGGIGLIALAGLWRWRRWALGLYGIVASASVVLDAIAGAPLAHHLAVIIGAGVVFALAYLNRSRFSKSEASEDPTSDRVSGEDSP